MGTGHAARVQIDHGGAEFPYLQLARLLRDRITGGEFGPGAKLPTINDITAETGLDPMTIRRSMRLLADEGLIVIVPGRGTFVAQPGALSSENAAHVAPEATGPA